MEHAQPLAPAPLLIPDVDDAAQYQRRIDRYCVRESRRYLTSLTRNHISHLRVFNKIYESRLRRMLFHCQPIIPPNRSAAIVNLMRYVDHLKSINIATPVVLPQRWTISDQQNNVSSIGIALVRAMSYLECDPHTVRYFKQQERIRNVALARERMAAERAEKVLYKLVQKTKVATKQFLESACPELCGICMDHHTHENTVKTSCGHCFGGECYKTMLLQKGAETKYEMGENNTCPICRSQNPVLNFWRARAAYKKKSKEPVAADADTDAIVVADPESDKKMSDE